MLIIKYEKNMYHNYIVMENIEGQTEDYQEEILINNYIKGFLHLEIRYFDDQKKYYYNVTGLHTLLTVFERKKPDRKQLQYFINQIIINIMSIRNYLLEENDIVLIPEQIFLHTEKEEIFLCYCPGYNEDIKNQLSRLLEYFMNKIEYAEKEAVVLIYSLYMKSRDENCKMNDFLKLLTKEQENTNKENSYQGNIQNNDVQYKDMQYNNIQYKDMRYNDMQYSSIKQKGNQHKGRQQGKDCINSKKEGKIPLIGMEEKVEKEVETMYYPLKNYIISFASLLLSILIIFIAFKLKILYQPFGVKIDKLKAGLLIIILLTANIFFILKLFARKNMSSKMCTEITYEKPYIKEELNLSKGLPSKVDLSEISETMVLSGNDTIILSNNYNIIDVKLIPEDSINYQTIALTEFPYFIGKLKYNTNACIVSPTVSKIHAKIVKEEEKYFVYDLNSTNGTFVNGMRLTVNGFSQIENNDRITFADVVYIFSCSSQADIT